MIRLIISDIVLLLSVVVGFSTIAFLLAMSVISIITRVL